MPLKLNEDILPKVKNAKYSQYVRVKVQHVWNVFIFHEKNVLKSYLNIYFVVGLIVNIIKILPPPQTLEIIFLLCLKIFYVHKLNFK